MFWGNWSDWSFDCDWLIPDWGEGSYCDHCEGCFLRTIARAHSAFARHYARLYDQVLMGTMADLGIPHSVGVSDAMRGVARL